MNLKEYRLYTNRLNICHVQIVKYKNIESTIKYSSHMKIHLKNSLFEFKNMFINLNQSFGHTNVHNTAGYHCNNILSIYIDQ